MWDINSERGFEMNNVDDYVTGHENDEESFDFENFNKGFSRWRNQIEEDLKVNRYDRNLLCINEVLQTVQDMIYDNTIVS